MNQLRRVALIAAALGSARSVTDQVGRHADGNRRNAALEFQGVSVVPTTGPAAAPNSTSGGLSNDPGASGDSGLSHSATAAGMRQRTEQRGSADPKPPRAEEEAMARLLQKALGDNSNTEIDGAAQMPLLHLTAIAEQRIQNEMSVDRLGEAVAAAAAKLRTRITFTKSSWRHPNATSPSSTRHARKQHASLRRLATLASASHRRPE